jgi:hypothetical protein
MARTLDVILDAKRKYKRGELSKEAAVLMASAAVGVYMDETDPEGVYGSLVRVSEVCKALDEWAQYRSAPLPTDSEYATRERKEFQLVWSKVRIAIGKSNMLYRTLILGEEPRRVPCPEHMGKWSGILWPDPTCGCVHEGNVTGWLPNEEVQ